MPTKKQKLDHTPDNPSKTPKLAPQLPLEIIDRVYANFDPVIYKKDRHALFLSLRVNKGFHGIAARHLYREVALNWLVNKGYTWKNAWYGDFSLLQSHGSRKDFLFSTYLDNIRYLKVHDHTHKSLFRSLSTSSPTVLDVLEIEISRVESGTSTSKHEWCNPCDPGQPGRKRPQLVRCHGLERFQAKAVILACSQLFYQTSRGGPFDIPRLSEETFVKTERVIIRPRCCNVRSDVASERLCLGSVPPSVTRIDILFQPSYHHYSACGQRYSPTPATRLHLLESFGNLLFTPDNIIPETCTIYLVNIGVLGSYIDPDDLTPPAKRPPSEVQDSVKNKVEQLILQTHGDTPATKAKVARLKFIGFEEYAADLKGLQRRFINASGWNSLPRSTEAQGRFETQPFDPTDDSDEEEDD